MGHVVTFMFRLCGMLCTLCYVSADRVCWCISSEMQKMHCSNSSSSFQKSNHLQSIGQPCRSTSTTVSRRRLRNPALYLSKYLPPCHSDVLRVFWVVEHEINCGLAWQISGMARGVGQKRCGTAPGSVKHIITESSRASMTASSGCSTAVPHVVAGLQAMFVPQQPSYVATPPHPAAPLPTPTPTPTPHHGALHPE